MKGVLEMQSRLYNLLVKHADTFHQVVPYNKDRNKLLNLDLTAGNNDINESMLADVDRFSAYINTRLAAGKFLYGIGGYNEHRNLYVRSRVFDDIEEPRRLHLGVDIWGAAGTPVYAPIGGVIHSFAFNNNYGDYGATIILQHQLDGFAFYTLYGHLGLKDIAGLQEGQYVTRGAEFAHFGEPKENGYWPPHLHFQVVNYMHQYHGDYPGVCKVSEKMKYLANCPNPDAILQMMNYVIA